jgi:hypothetical protein
MHRIVEIAMTKANPSWLRNSKLAITWRGTEAGHVSGRIIKVHTKDADYKGYTHHASPDDPQYEIKSDKTNHIAMHKGAALRKTHTWESFVRQGFQAVVFTVGHSTRSLAEFIALLAAHSVSRLIDVRTVPRSRHNPQFNRDTLPAALEVAGIRYAHVAGLGGFRHTHPGSLNMGWRNVSFRGFADYMQTPEFAENLGGLIEQATRERVVLMCAEAVPWRCHRSLIADALVVHGLRVEEIVNRTRRQIHALTPFAKVDGTAITYPITGATESGQADSRK